MVSPLGDATCSIAWLSGTPALGGHKVVTTSAPCAGHKGRARISRRGPVTTRETMASSNGYSAAYPLQFLARNPIEVDHPALERALVKRLGRVKATGQMFLLEDFPVQFREG